MSGRAKFVTLSIIVLGILTAGSTAAFQHRPGWGGVGPTLACFSWSALWALVLGAIGLWSMERALTCRAAQMTVFVLGGFMLRVMVLIATQMGVYFIVSPEWGQRTLLATVVYYLFVLAIELQHVNKLLQAKSGMESGARLEA